MYSQDVSLGFCGFFIHLPGPAKNAKKLQSRETFQGSDGRFHPTGLTATPVILILSAVLTLFPRFPLAVLPLA
jgi:hypothetical protein